MHATLLADGQPTYFTAWLILQGLLTAVVGFVGLRISNRQAKNAEYKTRLDLYDRRYATWQLLMEEVGKIDKLWEGEVGGDLHVIETRIRQAVWGASFLFKKPVTDAINELATLTGVFIADYADAFSANPHRSADSADVFRAKRQLHQGEVAEQKVAIDKALDRVATTMRPYLDFRNVGEVRTAA